MQTLDPEQIRKRLQDHNLRAVAKKAGVHHNALYRFMSGASDPRVSTILKLVKYLEDVKHG